MPLLESISRPWLGDDRVSYPIGLMPLTGHPERGIKSLGN